MQTEFESHEIWRELMTYYGKVVKIVEKGFEQSVAHSV
jgi:hypothetical protein